MVFYTITALVCFSISMKKAKSKLARKIGKRSYFQILWKDWKKERPQSGERIYSIVKINGERHMVMGEYFEETFSSGATFKYFRSSGGLMRFIDWKCEKGLIAWGRMEDYEPHESKK